MGLALVLTICGSAEAKQIDALLCFRNHLMALASGDNCERRLRHLRSQFVDANFPAIIGLDDAKLMVPIENGF